MNNAKKINVVDGTVELSDGNKKAIDNYILELEDRLIKIHKKLKAFEDVDPDLLYTIDGETLFEVMDLVEGK